jgi:hypothetical protein
MTPTEEARLYYQTAKHNFLVAAKTYQIACDDLRDIKAHIHALKREMNTDGITSDAWHAARAHLTHALAELGPAGLRYDVAYQQAQAAEKASQIAHAAYLELSII